MALDDYNEKVAYERWNLEGMNDVQRAFEDASTNFAANDYNGDGTLTLFVTWETDESVRFEIIGQDPIILTIDEYNDLVVPYLRGMVCKI